jgi:hypothetical protein
MPTKEPETPDPTMIYLPKGVLAAGKIINPKSEGPIRGVRVMRSDIGGMSVDATDGRCGIRVLWSSEHLFTDQAATVIIPGELADAIEKAIPKKGEPDEMTAILTTEPGTPNIKARISRKDAAVTFEGLAVEGDFPAMETVIPTYTPLPTEEGNCATTAVVSVESLLGILQSLKGIGVEAVTLAVPMQQGRLVTLTGEKDGPRAYACLMPRYAAKTEDEEDRDDVLPGMPVPEDVDADTGEELVPLAEAMGK